MKLKLIFFQSKFILSLRCLSWQEGHHCKRFFYVFAVESNWVLEGLFVLVAEQKKQLQ